MLFCSQCGEELPENAFFCLKCGVMTGKGLEAGVSSPWRWDREVEKAFSTAAKEMEKALSTVREQIQKSVKREQVACPTCGKKSQSDSKFCHNCGKCFT